MSKKTVTEVTEFAAEQMKAAGIRNASVDVAKMSVYLNVRRTFGIEGSVSVTFEVVQRQIGKENVGRFVPYVRINLPARNGRVVEMMAFMHLTQELTMFAVSLQAQLDEFEIPITEQWAK